MPTLTPKLGIKKTLGNETARRSSFNENYDIIDRMAAREPFLVKNAVYDSGNDRIDITIGAGRAAFLGTLVAKDTDTVYSIHEPSVNTSYYLYLKNDGTFLHNTTGGEMTGAVLIWKISTGVSVDEVTIQDMRGELPGAEARALKDELIPQIHTAQQTAENAASSATAAQATAENHATRHAAGGPDALTPAMIGAASSTDFNNHTSQSASLSNLGHVRHGVLTATIQVSSWSGSSAPYSNIVSVNGIQSSDTPIIDVVMSGTFSTDEQRVNAWGYIYRAVTGNNSITFYATDKPAINIPVQIKVMR
jgi:hypothetical protein